MRRGGALGAGVVLARKGKAFPRSGAAEPPEAR